MFKLDAFKKKKNNKDAISKLQKAKNQKRKRRKR